MKSLSEILDDIDMFLKEDKGTWELWYFQDRKGISFGDTSEEASDNLNKLYIELKGLKDKDGLDCFPYRERFDFAHFVETEREEVVKKIKKLEESKYLVINNSKIRDKIFRIE